MRALSLVVVLFVSCGPDLQVERAPVPDPVDAGRPVAVDAGAPVRDPLAECRALCPSAREVSIGSRGECVCSL